jgi:hypothetical protein
MVRALAGLVAAALVAVALPTGSLAAADGPAGIAFAQAEEGTFWCRNADYRKAADCALKACRKGAGGQECHLTRWCMPAGWSGMMVAWLPEFHTTQIVCGLPDEAAVGGALRAICDAAAEYTRCDFVRTIDPDGVETAVPDVSWPGPTDYEAAD